MKCAVVIHGKDVIFETMDGYSYLSEIKTIILTDWSR